MFFGELVCLFVFVLYLCLFFFYEWLGLFPLLTSQKKKKKDFSSMLILTNKYLSAVMCEESKLNISDSVLGGGTAFCLCIPNLAQLRT